MGRPSVALFRLFLVPPFLLLLLLANHSSAELKPKQYPMEFVTDEDVCLLCFAILGRWKEQAELDPREMRASLLSGCAKLDQPEEADKCRKGVTGANLQRLRKEKPEQICEAEGLCQRGQFAKLRAMEKSSRGSQPKPSSRESERPIPEVILPAEKGKTEGKNGTTASKY